MARLLCGDIAGPDFPGVIQQAANGLDQLALVNTPAEVIFQAALPAENVLRISTEGRIFSNQGEFRWRRLGNAVRCVYLGENPGALPLTDHSSDLNGLKPHLREFFLWGVRTDQKNEWLEQHVPHRFRYPVEGCRHPRGRVRLVLEEWRDEGGFPHFSRYYELQEAKGENHAAE